MPLTRKRFLGIPERVGEDELCLRIKHYFQTAGMRQHNAREVARALGFSQRRILRMMSRMLDSNMLKRPTTYSSRSGRQLSVTDNLELHPNYYNE